MYMSMDMHMHMDMDMYMLELRICRAGKGDKKGDRIAHSPQSTLTSYAHTLSTHLLILIRHSIHRPTLACPYTDV